MPGFSSIKDRPKPADFTDLFCSPRDQTKSKDLTLELKFSKIYTRMKTAFLTTHSYYNFISDVSRFESGQLREERHNASDHRSLRLDGGQGRDGLLAPRLHGARGPRLAAARLPAG